MHNTVFSDWRDESKKKIFDNAAQGCPRIQHDVHEQMVAIKKRGDLLIIFFDRSKFALNPGDKTAATNEIYFSGQKYFESALWAMQR